jgi:hypothetical protein
MSVRYDIKDNGANGWDIHDVWTGLPAIINGYFQIGLSFEDADDLADALNHLHSKQATLYRN